MDLKWASLHDYILCMMHDLVFGGFGLMGDAKETLLRKWYSDFSEGIEQKIEEIIDPPKKPEPFTKLK